MSRLVGQVKLQTQCLKSECKVRDSARTSKVNTRGLLSAETLNIYAESTCNFEKLVVRKNREKVRIHLPPPQSSSPLESAIYAVSAARNWPENHDFAEQSENHVSPTIPHSLLNSLKAAGAVPFLSECGPQVRCLARMAKWNCKLEANEMASLATDSPDRVGEFFRGPVLEHVGRCSCFQCST
jgi:hypothetical protein